MPAILLKDFGGLERVGSIDLAEPTAAFAWHVWAEKRCAFACSIAVWTGALTGLIALKCYFPGQAMFSCVFWSETVYAAVRTFVSCHSSSPRFR